MRDTSLENIPSGDHVAGAAGSPTRSLVLATISFALSFAAWGLVGGLASVFSGLYGLTASETAFLVAVRPPKRSVSMPIGSRANEPSSTLKR
jgi:hypothetical protein